MAGYPVTDPAGVDIYDEEGNLTHYNVGDTVPLSKLLPRRYSWLVNRGYLSEVEVDFGSGGAGSWGTITGTLSSQTDLQTALNAKLNLTGGTLTGDLTIDTTYKLKVDSGKLEILTPGNTGKTIFANTTTSATRTITFPNRSGTAALTSGADDITIVKSTPQFSLDKSSGENANINFKTGSSLRWTVQSDSVAESGGNAGTDFNLSRYSDAGSWIDNPLTVTRSTGDVSLSQNLSVGGYVDLQSARINSDLKTVSVTTALLLDSFSATLYRSAEYTVQLSQDTNYAQCKILVIHNGTDVAVTEYGFAEIGTSIPFEFSTNFSLGILELLITCSNANVTPVGVKFSRLLYDV